MKAFTIEAPEEQLEELRQRLALTRFPEAETVSGWCQGLPLARARELRDYWLHQYDWRQREAWFNRHPQFVTTIDGLEIHFIHRRSPHPGARPLILSHGWPGSVVEFDAVIDRLADPVAYGGHAEDAFHIVCPSLPGFGFSAKPARTGWGVEKISDGWNQLMKRLDYDRYFAQGGDWGSAITAMLGLHHAENCAGIHLNMISARPTPEAREAPDERDRAALAAASNYQRTGSGYAIQQSTRPQTLGYSLVDSPIGLAAWIIEKFREWSDCDGDPENLFSRQQLIDNVMYYWLPATGASAARLYWESFGSAFSRALKQPIGVPAGGTVFPQEIIPTPRSWAEQRFTRLVYWSEPDKGGHFAAFEQPELFVDELRACFRLMSL